MNKKEVKDRGIDEGLGSIRYCEVSKEDQREAGCECKTGQACEDCLTSAAYASEMNARQFSPFEFFAHDINECEDRSEGLWSAYDAGVGVGIKRGMKDRIARENQRTDEDDPNDCAECGRSYGPHYTGPCEHN